MIFLNRVIMTGIASGTPQNGFDLVNHMTMGTYSVGLTKGILFNLHVKGYTMIIEIVISSYQTFESVLKLD